MSNYHFSKYLGTASAANPLLASVPLINNRFSTRLDPERATPHQQFVSSRLCLKLPLLTTLLKTQISQSSTCRDVARIAGWRIRPLNLLHTRLYNTRQTSHSNHHLTKPSRQNLSKELLASDAPPVSNRLKDRHSPKALEAVLLLQGHPTPCPGTKVLPVWLRRPQQRRAVRIPHGLQQKSRD